MAAAPDFAGNMRATIASFMANPLSAGLILLAIGLMGFTLRSERRRRAARSAPQ